MRGGSLPRDDPAFARCAARGLSSEHGPPSEDTDATEPAAAGPAVGVTIVDDRFEPNNITVPAGTTLRFVNRGANWHSVAAFDGSFESGRIEAGASFAVRLDKPGTYQYLCQHHALRGMGGRITVQ